MIVPILLVEDTTVKPRKHQFTFSESPPLWTPPPTFPQPYPRRSLLEVQNVHIVDTFLGPFPSCPSRGRDVIPRRYQSRSSSFKSWKRFYLGRTTHNYTLCVEVWSMYRNDTGRCKEMGLEQRLASQETRSDDWPFTTVTWWIHIHVRVEPGKHYVSSTGPYDEHLGLGNPWSGLWTNLNITKLIGDHRLKQYPILRLNLSIPGGWYKRTMNSYRDYNW